MLDVNMLVPGSVVTHNFKGSYVYLAKDGDKFLFSRGIDLTERNLWTLTATGKVVTTAVVGATAYNSFGPLRVIGKAFEELKKGETVLVDTKDNLVFRICVVQDINLRKMTITCDGVEINVQSTEIYRTNY
jgi:hypothetical protein